MPANDRTVLDFWTKEFGTYVEFKKCSLLEIGCGCGELGLILANGVKQYYGIDPDKENILHARSHAGDKKTITYKVGRAEDIPFKKKFDIVFYTFSWHLITNFDTALKETRRVLDTDGILSIVEPSEETAIWRSPLLTKGSPHFSPSLHKAKIEALRRARDAIYKQNLFNIVEEKIGDESRPNLWILKSA